jgi:ABC-type cobalt transport system substrate-binding protein
MTEPIWKLLQLQPMQTVQVVWREWEDGRQESCLVTAPEYLAWLAEGNEPDSGEIGMLLIEQLRQELGQALAMHRDWLLKELARMNEQLARLDEVHAQTRQLSELQNHFRPLGV